MNPGRTRGCRHDSGTVGGAGAGGQVEQGEFGSGTWSAQASANRLTRSPSRPARLLPSTIPTFIIAGLLSGGCADGIGAGEADCGWRCS
jgi:hypothetical protein